MKTAFTTAGATLSLEPLEYGFIYLLLSHALYGNRMADHDFRNILGMSAGDAEALLDQLVADEEAAKALGSHWHSVC